MVIRVRCRFDNTVQLGVALVGLDVAYSYDDEALYHDSQKSHYKICCNMLVLSPSPSPTSSTCSPSLPSLILAFFCYHIPFTTITQKVTQMSRGCLGGRGMRCRHSSSLRK